MTRLNLQKSNKILTFHDNFTYNPRSDQGLERKNSVTNKTCKESVVAVRLKACATIPENLESVAFLDKFRQGINK